MTRDRAGNKLRSASSLKTSISGTIIRQDSVSAGDVDDLYHLRLSKRSRIDLNLFKQDKRGKIGLELFRLKHSKSQVLEDIGNTEFRKLKTGEIRSNLRRLVQLNLSGNQKQQLQRTLNSGEYYIRTYWNRDSKRSSLGRSSLASINSEPAPDWFGNPGRLTSDRVTSVRPSPLLQNATTRNQQNDIRYQLTLSVLPTSSSPSVVPLDYTPPVNPFLASSPWPTYHRNSYAQASTLLRGPEPTDKLSVSLTPNVSSTTSPWLQLSEAYPSGERVVWGATLTHVYKALIDGPQLQIIDEYQIDRNILTINWSLITLRGNQVYVPDPGNRRLLRFADQNPADPRSPIELKGSFTLPDSIPGSFVHLNVTYDGWLMMLTNESDLVAVRPDFSEYRTFSIPKNASETGTHNAFSIDEEGGMYFVSTEAMTRINWDGNQFSLGWRVPYNFRGPGYENVSSDPASELDRFLKGEPGTGSGTTPTLMGFGSMDKLVLVADSSTPNNLIAFWRDDIPADWQGLPGYDRRIAAVTPLPYSTPAGEGFTAENSPTAWGYDIAIAQYNGFSPDDNPLPGVQKLSWNPDANRLDLAWATDQVNFNNVLTYSAGSNLVYGSGRRNSVYYFWGLDWQTGEVKLEVPLGTSDDYLDQGNQVTLNDDRSVMFSTATGIVRIAPNP
jgi:hypothetical protein